MFTNKQKEILIKWNERKNFKNFCDMYHFWFHGGWCGFRIYRIIKNTISGKYKKLEKAIDN